MYLDIIILIVLFLSILDGLKNGLFVEFLSVFGLAINFIIAKYLTPKVIEFLHLSTNNNSYFITYIIIFWAIYIIVGIFLHCFRNIIEKQNKGLLTRFLGAILGGIKGFVIAIIIIFIFDFSVDKFSGLEKYGKGSHATEIFLKIGSSIEEYIPKAFKDKLNAIKDDKLVDRYINKLF